MLSNDIFNNAYQDFAFNRLRMPDIERGSEYERSWVILNPGVVFASEADYLGICKRYWLSLDPEVRLTYKMNLGEYSIMDKHNPDDTSISRTTWIKKLTKKQFNEYKSRGVICEDRLKVYAMVDGSIITLREYPNGKTIMIGEKDFKSKEECNRYVIPSYGKEVTDDYNFRGKSLAYENRR